MKKLILSVVLMAVGSLALANSAQVSTHPLILPPPTIKTFACHKIIQPMQGYKSYPVCTTDYYTVLYNAADQKFEFSYGFSPSSIWQRGVSNSAYYSPTFYKSENQIRSLVSDGDYTQINYKFGYASIPTDLIFPREREGILYTGVITAQRSTADSSNVMQSTIIDATVVGEKITYYYIMR